MSHHNNRQLPAADWIAVGLGVLGVVLGRFNLPGLGLLGLAAALLGVGFLAVEAPPAQTVAWVLSSQIDTMLLFGVTGWILVRRKTELEG